ncbi:MAG: Omp28 family outer membrane lipoprotein [Bacteroidota bacterium]
MKTKNTLFKLSIILFFIAIITYSCDKIEGPFTELQPRDTTAVVDTTDSVTYIRKVLVEDYTGHTCGNCPEAAISLDSILSRNKDKVVGMAIHAGFFAEIKTTGLFTYDFRNADGDAIDAFFSNTSKGSPNGMVNRVDFATLKHTKLHTEWSSIVATELAKPAVANIKLKVEYNSSTKNVSIVSTSKFLTDLDGAYKISLFITEDSIVKAQKDYTKPSPSNVANYTHKHVMRKGINGTWGDEIANGTAKKNVEVVKNYSIVLNDSWNEKKCHVVAFIYNSATYEVIQAEEAHVE